jgi:hypothetical protein
VVDDLSADVGEVRADVGDGGRWRSFVFALATGVVCWSWSEVGFWAHFRTDDKPVVWVLTWWLYSVVAYLVMRVAARFPMRGLAAVVVLGAFYGWLVEGTIANTVYLALPFSIVWTGLAWHGQLTIVVGWYLFPRALRAGGTRAWAWGALVGALWGAWGAAWWGAVPDGGQAPATFAPLSYALFVAVVTAAAGIGYGIQDRTGPRPGDRSSRWALVLVIGALVAWSVPVVVLPLPWAPLVLAPLLGVAWFALRRLTPQTSAVPTDVIGWTVGVPWSRLHPLVALPVAAVLVYLAASPLSTTPTGTGVPYWAFVATIIVLSVAGTTATGWALIQALRSSPRVPAT